MRYTTNEIYGGLTAEEIVYLDNNEYIEDMGDGTVVAYLGERSYMNMIRDRGVEDGERLVIKLQRKVPYES